MLRGFQNTTASETPKSVHALCPNFQHANSRSCLHLHSSCHILIICDCYRKDGGRSEIYLKREDLNHTGAHKINNSLGQALLCLRMGKKRIIAETGAGQHGVATATVCARFGLQCIIYMGSKVREPFTHIIQNSARGLGMAQMQAF